MPSASEHHLAKQSVQLLALTNREARSPYFHHINENIDKLESTVEWTITYDRGSAGAGETTVLNELTLIPIPPLNNLPSLRYSPCLPV